MRYVHNLFSAFVVFLLIGGVTFHAMQMYPSLSKPVIDRAVDPVGDLIREMEEGFKEEILEDEVEVVALCDDRCFFETVVKNEMFRLGVSEAGFSKVHYSVSQFLDFVKIVESNGDPMARAKTSSAMSLFQFTIPSVPTAVNRLRNYMTKHQLGPLPAWAVELQKSPTSLYHVPELRQAILTLVNIAEQKGSDQLLRQFFQGESEAAKEIYLIHHHTDPDLATHRRVEKIFHRFF